MLVVSEEVILDALDHGINRLVPLDVHLGDLINSLGLLSLISVANHHLVDQVKPSLLLPRHCSRGLDRLDLLDDDRFDQVLLLGSNQIFPVTLLLLLVLLHDGCQLLLDPVLCHCLQPLLHLLLLLFLELAEVELATQPADTHDKHDEHVDDKDGPDRTNHEPAGQFLVLKSGCEREERQMVGGQLQERLVHDLNPTRQSRIIRASEAQVDQEQDVRGQEDVDEDVWVVDADECKEGVEEPSCKEHRRVEPLPEALDAHSKIETADLCFHFLLLKCFTILVQKDGKEYRQYDLHEKQDETDNSIRGARVVPEVKD